MKYLNRIIEKEIETIIKDKGTILITGPKACGKTETGKYFSKSIITIDNTPSFVKRISVDQDFIFNGLKPRQIDEWQLQEWIWNSIRHMVDNNEGPFILTGSSKPSDSAVYHSGAMRILTINMKPMIWSEMSINKNKLISFYDCAINNRLSKNLMCKDLNIIDVLTLLTRGGWPSLIDKSLQQANKYLKSYIENIANVDIINFRKRKREPEKLLRFIKSYSRNVGTNVSNETIMKDADISKPTFNSYFQALHRLGIIDELPPWYTHIRSKASMRQFNKRYLVDPSLAIASMEVTIDELRKDPNYSGFLFENEAIKTLKVLAQDCDAKVYYYRDSNGLEIDAIIKFNNDEWSIFEIKLGINLLQEAKDTFKKFLEIIDFKKVKKPKSINVIIPSGTPFKTDEGYNVIPLNLLGR